MTMSIEDRLREAEDQISALRFELGQTAPTISPAHEVRPTEKKRRLMPTDWPKVGGRDLKLARTDLFMSEEFRARWRPGPERRGIYVGASYGLRDLSHLIHLPLFKIGVTSADGVWSRMKSLRRAAYGSAWYKEGACVEDTSGWDNWFPSQIFVKHRPPSAGSPVEFDSCTIYVDLPEDMHWTAFDDALDAEIGKARLADWVQSEAGRDHCAVLGLDPARFQRLTLYGGGEEHCLRQATEICCFTLYGGADRLVEIAERIILRHMGLLPATAATASDAAETSSEAA